MDAILAPLVGKAREMKREMAPFRLQTLGRLRLIDGDGREVIPGRRKLLALLAYLAMADRPPVPRAELADAFWGDAAPERAGGSLRKALSTLRSVVGDALVETERGLRVDEKLLRCDAWELGESKGDAEGFLGRDPPDGGFPGKGTFLPAGEELGGAPFRLWLEGERARIDRIRGMMEGASGMDPAPGKSPDSPDPPPESPLEPPLELRLEPPENPTPLPGVAPALTGLIGSLRVAPGVGGADDHDLARQPVHHPWLRTRYPAQPTLEHAAPGAAGEVDEMAALAGALWRTLASVAEEVPVVLVEGDPAALDPLSRGVLTRLLHKPPPGVSVRGWEWKAERGAAGSSVVHPRRAGHRWAPGRGVGVLALLTLLATALLVHPALKTGVPDPDPSAMPVPERLAVLPFAVRGGPEMAYLSEGMVDLLALNLAGTGVLQVVDPHSTLALLGSSGSPAGGTSDPQELLRRLGAGLFLRGSVVEAGGRIRISGTLTDGAGSVLASGDAGPGDEADLFRLADDLTRQLLDGILVAPGEELNRSATHSTASLPALRAFLEGERLFRMGRYGEAETRFREATARDPGFALAHFRTAVALEWTGAGSPHLLETALAAALERAEGLPLRDRRLLEGFAAYHLGDAVEAEHRLRAILGEDPTHVAAWLLLAEVLFHLGPRTGRPGSLMAAGEAFHRVLELVPDHEEALVHQVRIAAASGEWEEVAALHERLRTRLHPSAPILFPILALDAALDPDPRRWDRLLDGARGESPLGVLVAAGFLTTYTALPERSADLIRLLTDPAVPPELRGMAHLRLAFLAGQGGQWE
ncbi:MAG: hypothetical protein EA421_16290, partial [Gemmatimonadales bacterium]